MLLKLDKLSLNYMSVLQLECAFADTFVLLTTGSFKQPNILSHLDR